MPCPLLFAALVLAADPPDKIAAQLDKARATFETTAVGIRKRVKAALAAAAKQARGLGDQPAVARLTREADGFEWADLFPSVAADGDRAAAVAARAQLRLAYQTAVTAYTRGKEDAKAKSLADEIDLFDRHDGLTPRFYIVLHKPTGRALTPEGTEPGRGARLTLDAADGRLQQQWLVGLPNKGVGLNLRQRTSGLTVNVPHASVAPGNQLILWAKGGEGDNERFELTRRGGGVGVRSLLKGGGFLTGRKGESPAALHPAEKSEDQDWQFVPVAPKLKPGK